MLISRYLQAKRCRREMAAADKNRGSLLIFLNFLQSASQAPVSIRGKNPLDNDAGGDEYVSVRSKRHASAVNEEELRRLGRRRSGRGSVASVARPGLFHSSASVQLRRRSFRKSAWNHAESRRGEISLAAAAITLRDLLRRWRRAGFIRARRDGS